MNKDAYIIGWQKGQIDDYERRIAHIVSMADKYSIHPAVVDLLKHGLADIAAGRMIIDIIERSDNVDQAMININQQTK